MTGSLDMPRAYHTATLLRDGKVMVAGGGTYSIPFFSSAELYDPATGLWTTTASLHISRNSHTATLLPDGTVLVAGGYNSSGIPFYLSSSEIYESGLGFNASWQPRISSITSPLQLGDSLMLTGSGFRGASGASGGNTQDSA